MTRRELYAARFYKAALDRRRFLLTQRATQRGDMRYLYARMIARAPQTLYRSKPLVVSSQLLHTEGQVVLKPAV